MPHRQTIIITAHSIQTKSIWKSIIGKHTIAIIATRAIAATADEVDADAKAIDKRKEEEKDSACKNYYFRGRCGSKAMCFWAQASFDSDNIHGEIARD